MADTVQARANELCGRITKVRAIFILDDGTPFWYQDCEATPGQSVTIKVPEPGDVVVS